MYRLIFASCTLLAGCSWLGAVQAQTITTAPVAAIAGPMPVPVGNALTLLMMTLVLLVGLVLLLRRLGVSIHTLRSLALGGAMLVVGGAVLWSDDVLAQLQLLQRQFTQADGETLGVPVQAIESDGVITGFVPVEFSNATTKRLQITGIGLPTWKTCFPNGAPAALPLTAVPPAGTQCATGAELTPAQACWLDVTQLCGDAVRTLQGAAPSVLGADTVSVNEGQSVTGNVLANDSDADGPLLVASYVLDGARHLAGVGATVSTLGSFSLQTDGSFSFSPAKPFPVAEAKVAYTTQTGAVAELTLTVNRTPQAVDDNQTGNENTVLSISVLANDTDPDGDTLSVSSFTQGVHGLVSPDGVGQLRYTPQANFHGSDSFTYTISDGKGLAATATVHVTLSIVNSAPVAPGLSLHTPVDVPVNSSVIATDADGDSLSYSITTPPSNGTSVLNMATGNFTYTPSSGYSGEDSFVVTVSDGLGGSVAATVSLWVGNRAPVAGDDFYTIAEDSTLSIPFPLTSLLSNDTDPDGDVLSVYAVGGPVNGSFSIVGGNLIFTPPANFFGQASFSYNVTDSHFATATATVHITVLPVNDAPVATDDSAAVAENDSVAIAVRGNDVDSDGDALTVEGVTQGANGSVVVDLVTGNPIYTPNAGFTGSDSFTYTINDGRGGTDTATVFVAVGL